MHRTRAASAESRGAPALLDHRPLAPRTDGSQRLIWLLDFHHAARKVLTRSGTWVEPMLRDVINDRSCLLRHLQWYLEDTAERLVHGITQAFMKLGLPLYLSCAGCRAHQLRPATVV